MYCLMYCLPHRLVCQQSIERHQADLPLSCLTPLAGHVHVLQVDNVRLTTQVRLRCCSV